MSYSRPTPSTEDRRRRLHRIQTNQNTFSNALGSSLKFNTMAKSLLLNVLVDVLGNYVEGLSKENLKVDNINIPGPDQYAIVHMIKCPLESVFHSGQKKQLDYKAHPRSVLFHIASKMIDGKTKEPTIAFIPTSSIHSPCIAIPLHISEQNQPHSFLFLQSKTTWNKLFVRSMRRSIRDSALN